MIIKKKDVTTSQYVIYKECNVCIIESVLCKTYSFKWNKMCCLWWQFKHGTL